MEGSSRSLQVLPWNIEPRPASKCCRYGMNERASTFPQPARIQTILFWPVDIFLFNYYYSDFFFLGWNLGSHRMNDIWWTRAGVLQYYINPLSCFFLQAYQMVMICINHPLQSQQYMTHAEVAFHYHLLYRSLIYYCGRLLESPNHHSKMFRGLFKFRIS